MLSPCTNMKRTASQAFEDPEPPILKPVLELTLHIALSPIQVQALLDQRPILPDPYSSRFGLRMDPIKALERAHYFMCWSPPYHHRQRLSLACGCPYFTTSRNS